MCAVESSLHVLLMDSSIEEWSNLLEIHTHTEFWRESVFCHILLKDSPSPLIFLGRTPKVSPPICLPAFFTAQLTSLQIQFVSLLYTQNYSIKYLFLASLSSLAKRKKAQPARLV